MRIRILRQKSPTAEPYWESFVYDGPRDTSVAGMLDHLNYHDDIVNEAGLKTQRIMWECSCLQGACGACAMVINGMPALACDTFLRDLAGDEIVLRPLTKFPTIRDLVVDRASIQENLKRSDVYIGSYQPVAKASFSHQYDAAKCLKCGLCLEICPNYTNGQSFFGAVFANDCYLVYARNREKSRDIKKTYAQHFGNTCSKSLTCMDVCPMQISTIASMAKLNR
ncbi:MAG: 4Fe-4S binding protein [Atopobiaceae bacterium]|nr:4Fe-4S binding protein [Atopobiaceae bacterium]